MGYGIVAIIVLVFRPAYRWYMARKKAAADAETAAAAQDAQEIQQAVRASVADNKIVVEMGAGATGAQASDHVGTSFERNPLNESFS